MDYSADISRSYSWPRVNRRQVEFLSEALLVLATRTKGSDLVKETIRPCRRTAAMRLLKNF
jgi:hypothetical protein